MVLQCNEVDSRARAVHLVSILHEVAVSAAVQDVERGRVIAACANVCSQVAARTIKEDAVRVGLQHVALGHQT